ncbi:hypothetical protein V6Z11_A08G052200 [Gossypium hirsutum]
MKSPARTFTFLRHSGSKSLRPRYVRECITDVAWWSSA